MSMLALAVKALTQTASPLQTAGTGHCWALIQADSGNSGTVTVGDATTQPFTLAANIARMFGPSSATGIYVKSTALANDKVNVILYDQRP